ncbi:MAG TPA: NAD(P)H-dependent oxidoreductase [Acidimicrobiales bacterium]
MDQPLDLVTIIGSTREGRFGPRVARWFADLARDHGAFGVDVVDLAAADLPVTLTRQATPAVEDYRARLDRADAFVVVTPEYNHGYPAPLKQAIDLAYTEWQAKPVGFVSYGGMAGGLRAVEQLRQVFAELHAATVRDVVSLHNPWSLFDDDARTHEPTGAEAAAKTMLDRLAWWARALRAARDAAPYAA